MRGESYDEDFEYDEADDEADDEVFAEADDEADDEVFAEADDEADDEVFAEADDEADDEVFAEADDEADDEAVVSASASASADRTRRDKWAQALARDRRVEAQRAAATSRNLSNRIRSIQGAGRTRVQSVSPLRGAGGVTAVLPNGRRTQMRISPAPAPISEVNRLRTSFNTSDRKLAMANAANSKAIANLSAAQAAAIKRMTEQQVKSDRELGKRIVEGDSRIDKRISKELGSGASALQKHRKQTKQALRRQRQRSMWNGVLLASAMPFYAAYGDRSDPFGKNNLILTASSLGWMLGDEVVDQFLGRGKAGRNWSRGATTWSYLAPIGNGATAYFLLKDEPHERFITGTVSADASGNASATLKLPDGSKKQLAFAIGSDGKAVTPTIALDKITLSGVAANSTAFYIVDTQPTAA